MTDIWSRFAGEPEGESLDYWEYFGTRLVERADIRNGVQVLDVGCGAGSSLFPAAVKVGMHGGVVGIDICDH